MVKVLVDALAKDWEISAATHETRKVDMLFIDSAGICGPIARRLRELGYTNVVEVNFGAHSSDPKFFLMRSYMWGKLKEALPALALDKSTDLLADLIAPNYSYTKKVEILLEPKAMIRKPERLGRSCDDADALCLTYAMPVISKQAQSQRNYYQQLGQGPGYGWRPVSAYS